MGNVMKGKYDNRGTVDLMRNVIVPNTSFETAIDQLAEEATELSHAAQKVARIMRGDSPTPITLEQAIKKLESEYADVKVCAICLTEKGFHLEDGGIADEERNKILRWADRIETKQEETK